MKDEASKVTLKQSQIRSIYMLIDMHIEELERYLKEVKTDKIAEECKEKWEKTRDRIERYIKPMEDM